jgi:Peptidase family M28
MYRGSWLLVAIPLLLALLSIARPAALAAPSLPPTFDGRGAAGLADQLSSLYPDRLPGSPGALGAAQWVEDQLASYGYRTGEETFSREPFTANVPGRGRVPFLNLVATALNEAEAKNRRARGPVIVVVAHRDDGGTGPGANDNASGTAALLELARAYGRPPGQPAGGPRVRPSTTLVFVSTDGGVYGGAGAQRFVDDSRYRRRVGAVVNLDAIAGSGRTRLERAGDSPRTPSARMIVTAAARILDQTGSGPGRQSAIGQLIDLGFPFSLYEQAPFLKRGIPALTLTTSGSRPRQLFGDTERSLNTTRLGEIGRAAQSLVGSLDADLAQASGTSSYLYLGSRLVRGWAIQLVLITMLVPFLASTIDLFARCRRRGIALRPALRAYRARLLFWLLLGGLFELFAAVGVWPGGAARPLDPASAAASHWPVAGLLGLGALCAVAWLVARGPLVARRPVTAEEDLAGHVAALLALGLLGLVVVATNPFALLFLLPSLHAWLWLPQVRGAPFPARLAVFAAGFLGPALLLGSFAIRFGLGLDAPWYLAELVAVGYVGVLPVVLALIWAAAAAQLAVLAAGRYAPYPTRSERPRGPLRETVRSTALALRRLRTRHGTPQASSR